MAVLSAVHSTHEDGKTEACLLRFVNKSYKRVKILWVGFDGSEACYLELEPGHARPQQTYTTHVWRVRFADTNRLIGEYSGPSAAVEVQSGGSLSLASWTGDVPQPKPEWGDYGKRGEALGIEIWSYECVELRAIRIAEHIIRRMLEASPPDVVRRMVAGGAQVAVIGRSQVTTDIPAHAFLRWSEGGRDTDSTTRGLGGTEESPTTSCGEENLIMEDDRFYSCENILVHEFGHAVMNIGLTPDERATVKQLYQKAYRSGSYDRGCYMMENEDEYWAEGTQAWFEATIRTDVTSGVNTREKLRARDPGLASMMTRAYGDGAWRYPHDSPAPFRERERKDPALATGTAGPPAPSGRGPAGSDEEPITRLAAPGVEESMERMRLAASSGLGAAGWASTLTAGCSPGGVAACGGGGFMSACGPSAGVGCGTALWTAVREAVVGHPARSTVKLS